MGDNDKTLRLNELYTSTQGEGPRAGIMTVFARFSGCNFRCAGWPCDTQHAIQPKLYKNDPKFKGRELALKVADDFDTVGNVCITGGEPLMQPEEALADFTDELLNYGYTLELFTNGSFPLPRWTRDPSVITMLDWKLPGSEEEVKPTQAATRRNNAKSLDSLDGIKFVCKDYTDFAHAVMIAQGLRREGVTAQFWVGVAYGVWSEADLVAVLQDSNPYGFRLNVQIHKYIHPGVERGI